MENVQIVLPIENIRKLMERRAISPSHNENEAEIGGRLWKKEIGRSRRAYARGS